MVSKYVAIKNDEVYEIMDSLDKVAIKYEFYGDDEEWSVLKMYGFNGVAGIARTYDNALLYAKNGSLKRRSE